VSAFCEDKHVDWQQT